MFTGIVEMRGTLVSRDGHRLVVRGERAFADPVRGESIAVNGCCLTLEVCRGAEMVFHTLSETLDRTNLGRLKIGAAVNLERALRLGDRLGGHMVSGHVDAVGEVVERVKRGDVELTVGFPPELAPYIVRKGSIAVDGVSLTVARLEADRFTVCLIPVTLADTALAERAPGDRVNLETDLAGKYILRRFELAEAASAEGVTLDTLARAGFL